MRIVFSCDIFVEQRFGGISRYFNELHRGFLARGENSTVIAGPYINDYLVGTPAVVGVKVPPTRGLSPRFIAATALERLWLMRSSADTIYHKTYYRGRRPRVPRVVLTVYDMIHEKLSEYFPQQDPTTKAKHHWCREADLILAISQSTKNDIIEIFGVPESKVRVTHLGVSIPRAQNPEAWRQRFGPYLLYVGIRSKYKNFNRLLQAYAQSCHLAEVNLLCVGGGPFTNEELALAHELGVSTKLHQVTVSDAELANAYAAACGFIYPSLYEGFGLPPLEAMSLGCPVLCGQVSSLPEVVGNAGVYFDPYQPESMCAAIDHFLDHETTRNELVQAGLAQAKLFTWDATVAATLDAYRSLV